MDLGRALCGCALSLIAACGNTPRSGPPDEPPPPPPPDSCDGLACFVVDCGAKGLEPTRISGTVFAPNGTLPLFGVTVYVPASDPGPLPAGVTCDQCTTDLPGGSVTSTSTDEAGHFTLKDVPATTDVPVVIQVGKWRRQFKMPAVAACQDHPLASAQTTLPRTQTEGDMPKIAITTGNADALECLVRKLGVADSEFGTAGDTRAVHLYEGNGAKQFAGGFGGGSGRFAAATSFWNTTAGLGAYDITLLSCEGAQNINGGGSSGGGPNINAKPQASMNALEAYANAGGRVFMSHWHNVWIGGDSANPASSYGIAKWKPVITWDFAAAQDEQTQLTIVDETVPKGSSFATWLLNVGASTTRDEVQVSQPRYTARSSDPTLSDRYIFVDPARSTPTGKQSSQDVLFTTPIDAAKEQRCGKVVFSDMHVASGSTSNTNTPFPNACNTGDLTPQEKALAFIFFDIASCVSILQ